MAEKVVEVKTKKDKWKKKSFYSVLSPKVFGEKVIGDTMAFKNEQLIGRQLYVPLNVLTGNVKQFQTKIKLRISEVDGENAKTEYYGQETTIDKISRMIRRWSSRIDSVVDIPLKDKKLRIKCLTVTIRRVTTSVKNEIRKEVSDMVLKDFKDKKLDEIVNEINTNQIQVKVTRKVSKIYPVRMVEIRKTEIHKQEKKIEVV